MARLDRTDFVPKHAGDHVLPNEQLFIRLLFTAHQNPTAIAVRDLNAGIERTYHGLLNDVLSLRRDARKKLSPKVLQELDSGAEVYVAILAPGSYEYVVAVLTALCLGAAVNPLNSNQPVEEASYYVGKSKTPLILASQHSLDLGNALADRFRSSQLCCLPILPSCFKQDVPTTQIVISSNLRPNPNAAGMLIFTSGTTGPPKGAVIRRGVLIDPTIQEQMQVTSSDVLSHVLPVHHATGIWVGVFPFLSAGACIEFKSGSFDPAWMWERWRQGGLTFFSGVPTIYMRMMRYYQTTLSKLPPTKLAEYTKACQQFRVAICGTSALPLPIASFWSTLFQGRGIKQRYGSTETGVVFLDPFSSPSSNSAPAPDGSTGEVALGVDVKLSSSGSSSEEDEGEILTKTSTMFSKYLDDPIATQRAHTEDGYFRTGDIARREGKYYWIIGRASVDIIKSGGYKISALDVEREILSLPYVSEVMVVGVPDLEFGERVAAVVSLRNDEIATKFLGERGRNVEELKLDDLRDDLRERVAGYKLPTVLYVLGAGEEIPKSATNKVVKKVLGPKFFPEKTYREVPGMQVWDNLNLKEAGFGRGLGVGAKGREREREMKL